MRRRPGRSAGVAGSVAGTFTYTPAAGTVLPVGNNQTLSVTFTPTDTTDYTSATATVTISVTAPPPVGLSPQGGHDDRRQLDQHLRHAGLRGHRQRHQPSLLRHRHPQRPVHLYLGQQLHRPRALQDAGGTGRIAAAWYSTTSFTVDVDITDGNTHNLELYFVDWDNTGRSETVKISNPSNGTVLNTQTVSSFHSGVYLDYAVSGNILITITKTAGSNAVLNGLFFDPSSATKSTPTITWANPANIVYGTALSTTQLDATASVPGTFSYSAPVGTVLKAGNNQTLSVTFTPTDTTDYTTTTATALINVTQATPTITWANPASIVSGTALSSTQLDATSSWTVAGVAGSVAGTFTYTPAAGTVLPVGNNQTLSVTFAPTDTTDFTSATATVTISVTAASGPSASFLKEDTTTEGNWINTYGSQGYEVIGNATSLPSYATVTPSGQSHLHLGQQHHRPPRSPGRRRHWPYRRRLVFHNQFHRRRQYHRRQYPQPRTLLRRLGQHRP